MTPDELREEIERWRAFQGPADAAALDLLRMMAASGHLPDNTYDGPEGTPEDYAEVWRCLTAGVGAALAALESDREAGRTEAEASPRGSTTTDVEEVRQLREIAHEAAGILNPVSGFLRKLKGPQERHAERVRELIRSATRRDSAFPAPPEAKPHGE